MSRPDRTSRCPRCDADNRAGARFCAECGAKLTEGCARCGAELPVGARFCSSCGAPVEPGAPENDRAARPADDLKRLVPTEYAQRLVDLGATPSPERRFVTILFCDVKGSTALAEHLDPEDVLEIMNGAFEVLIPPVYKHEGTLARLMGDAILAFFGAPVAHEDDPERAVRAALDILAGAAGYADRLARERGILGFNVRVGINTGLVVVGEVGSDLRVEYTAMGDAVNLAARMEQAAEPGTILITAATYRQVRGLFQCELLAPLVVKGKSEPVSAYRVVAAQPRAFRSLTRGVEGVETRMVGRDAEMKLLQETYLAAANDRERQFVTVTGEPGLGKSRLMFEFERWLDRQSAPIRILRARAGHDLQAVPYGLFRSLFALDLGIGDGAPAVEVRRRLEEGFSWALGADEESLMKSHFVARLLGYDLPDSAHTREATDDPQQVRDRAIFYLTEYFAAAATTATVVMFLEDIHWADDSSLDLLGRLARDLSDCPWLAVCATRPILFERRPHWGEGLSYHRRVDLIPLSRRASHELVDHILQRVDQTPDALRELIVSGSEGNPYFVEELIKMLVDDGVIVVAAGGWHVEKIRLAEAHVPASLTGILQARLDHLRPDERTTLQQASVVGRVFWDLTVKFVGDHAPTPGSKPDVPAALATLRGREMVFHRESSSFQGPQEYVFKHALLRQVTYDGIVRRLRQRYHSLTADWLIAQAGERASEHAGQIAEHLELAGRNAEAAIYLQVAAESAAARYANEEAIRYYRRVLAFREALPADSTGAPLATLHERLGDLHFWLTRHAEAKEAYERALTLPEAQERLARARLLRKIANTLRDHYAYEEALQIYADAENALGEAPETGPEPASVAAQEWWREWIDARLDRAQLHYWQDQPGEGLDLLVAAQPTVERYGTPEQRIDYSMALTANAFRRDRMTFTEATAGYMRLAQAAVAESRLGRNRPSVLFRLGFYSLFAGELPAAEEYITTALRQSERTGDVSLQARCLTYLGMVCRTQGRDDEVERYASRGLEVARSAGMAEYVGTARANQAWLAWRRGDLDAAEAHGRAALALWAQLPKGMASVAFQWTALWPLMSVALHRGAVTVAADCARDLLRPSQMRLDDEVEDVLERAIRADDRQDALQARELLDHALVLAQRMGHL